VRSILPQLHGSKVRFAYATDGQPEFSHSDNVIFVWAEESADEYGRQVETTWTAGAALRRRTVVWTVHITAYGPEASENINKIKTGLLSEGAKRLLAADGLFYIPRLEAPQRIPENADGVWWERWDWRAEFNSLRSDSEQVDYFETADIIVSAD
jgi:hypothetical protein